MHSMGTRSLYYFPVCDGDFYGGTMRLGDIIEALEALPGECPVFYAPIGNANGVGVYPGAFDSYRGYYDRLMLGANGEPCTVAELLNRARAADGATFTGYKGGEYEMRRDTVVYVADYGRTSDNRPVAIEKRDELVVIVVAHVPEW